MELFETRARMDRACAEKAVSHRMTCLPLNKHNSFQDMSTPKYVLVSEGSSLSAREAITALAWRAIGSVSETPIPFVWGVSHDLLPIITGVHPSAKPRGRA